MKKQFERTALLLGEHGVQKLNNSKIAIFGVGGVGGYCVEALARAGVGELILVDKDVVDETNINRQIIALHSTVSRPKTQVLKERIHDINPDCKVQAMQLFFSEQTSAEFDFSSFDYVVDAVDNVSAKVELILQSKRCNTPVISAMGAGNKLFPERFEIADISKTQVCPLARAVRKKLKESGVVSGVKVVYSKEPPVPTAYSDAVGSVSFTPSVMGLLMASQVIKDLVESD